MKYKNKIILENKLKIKKFFLQQGVADETDVDAIFRLLNSKIKIKLKTLKFHYQNLFHRLTAKIQYGIKIFLNLCIYQLLVL